MQTEISGDLQKIQQTTTRALILKTDRAEAHIYIYSSTIIRINITKSADKDDESFAVIQKPTNEFAFSESDNSIEVKTSALKVVINKSPLRFRFSQPRAS